MKLPLLFWLGCMSLALSLQAQDDPRKYFFFDRGCMKKYDYQPKDGFNALPFVDFHLPVSKTKVVVFRTELNKQLVTEMQPGDFTQELFDCDHIKDVLKPEYLADVHNSLQLAFVLEAKKGGYSTLYQVKEVYTMELSADALSWTNPLAGFDFKRAEGNTKTNLFKDGNRGGRVFWTGASTKEGCLETFRFKQLSGFMEIPAMDLYFVENVGLVEIKSEKGGSMALQAINGRPIGEYMEKVCKIRDYNAAKRQNPGTKPSEMPKDPNTGRSVYDPLDPNAKPGEVVRVKPGEFPSGEFTSRGDDGGDVPNVYVVQEGDNLYKIAQKFGTSVDELVRINQLKSAAINRGQKLKIKDDGTAPPDVNPIYVDDPIAGIRKTVHVVHQGETLGGIARKYKIKIATIYALNGLESDFIDINQKLVVAEEPLP